MTFDRGILDRQARLEKLDSKKHLTAGPLTASDVCLTAGRLTAVTFDRGIFDRQPGLENLDQSDI